MLPRAAAFVAVIVSGLAGLAAAAPARAEGGPVIAIPTRPGVPVVINGRDASYAVVEGDWGLYRPGAVPITVIGDAPLQPNYVYQQRSAYHPKFGHAPPSGRNEVEPPPDHPLPEPAEFLLPQLVDVLRHGPAGKPVSAAMAPRAAVRAARY